MIGENISGSEENKRNEAGIVSPIFLQEYRGYLLQEKISLLGLRISDNMMSVYAIVKEYFENNGFDASFDELYEEAKQLVEAVQKDSKAERTDKVMHELESYGNYQYLKDSVKAAAFKFDVSDTSENLKMFINLLGKLGVWMEKDTLYEEYQKIYDETVNMSVGLDKEQEMMRNSCRRR